MNKKMKTYTELELDKIINDLLNKSTQDQAKALLSMDDNLMHALTKCDIINRIAPFFRKMQGLKCISCFHSLQIHAYKNVSFIENGHCSWKDCGCKEFIADNLTWIENEANKNGERQVNA